MSIIPSDEISIPPGRKRCPNGYHKNKKTGKCTLKKKKVIQKQSPMKQTVTTINNNSPFEEQQISLAISELVEQNQIKSKGNKTYVRNIVPLIRKQLTKQKSFSPEINKKLITINTPKEVSNIFGCGIEKYILEGSKSERGSLKVMIGKNRNGKPICGTRKNKKAVQILLNNLRSSKTLDCSKVVAPVQLQSNCWFNTMFMNFFVSDKGRKFFRFFRQLMIEGKQSNGVTVKPPALAKALFILNACVEACHNLRDISDVKELGLIMDTNNIIRRIYKAIPKGQYTAIKNVGFSNNPLSYYKALVNFLGNNSLYIHNEYVSDKKKLDDLENGKGFSSIPDGQMPDVVTIQIIAKRTKFHLMTNKPVSLKINSQKYVLDSAIVRDTEKNHFCSLLTCGGKEMGYDGMSLSRIQPFEWKGKINKDISWTFEGSVWNRSNKNILWNFCREYVILFYYRID